MKKKVTRKSSIKADVMAAITHRGKNADTLVPMLNKSMQMNVQLTRALIAVSTIFVVTLYLYANKPTGLRHIVQDRNGKMVGELKVLSNPLTLKKSVSVRIDECVRRSFNLSFQRNQKQLNKVRGCYTGKGYQELVTNIERRGIIKDLTRSYSVANLMPRDQMRVTGVNKDLLERETMQVKGSYNYQIDNGDQSKSKARYLNYKVDVVAVVVEVPIHQSPYGYAINRLSVRIKSVS